MSIRSQAWAAVAAATLFLAPGWAVAQAGFGAWDFEHGAAYGPYGNPLGNNASGSGVANPLGFKESTPQLTALPAAKTDSAIEYARGFTDLNIGRFLQAEEDFDLALKVDRNNPKTLFMLGEAKVALGDLKGAEHAFEKALKNDPQQIVVRGEYAVVLARLGQADQAQAQLANLNARALACGGACPEADDFKAEVGRIQAALSTAPSAARGAG
jgi:tetratricopeptide (TPR) repeat protein